MRAGKCWRLYPEAFHQNFMPPHTLAEMLRTPLEELVLQVRQDAFARRKKRTRMLYRLHVFQGYLLVQPDSDKGLRYLSLALYELFALLV